jgi:tetratricopeptide (TPR) repeat protein
LPAIDATACSTTANVCHTRVKALTTPASWEHRPTLTTEGGRQRYTHEYIEAATGRAQPGAPDGTASLCELLAADPATAALVGRPTVFLSHAWKYAFGDLVAALEAFQAARPAGEPELVFWIDIFSIDQHKTGSWPLEWWSTTFKEAIRLIGHMVMVMAPWDAPVPLTRAWCLWELFCTVDVGAQFSVALGPSERAAFEASLENNDNPTNLLLDAFAKVDVAAAEAGKVEDGAMIKAAVARLGGGGRAGSAGGAARLNGTAKGAMTGWLLAEAKRLVDARRGRAGLLEGPAALRLASVVAVMLSKHGDQAAGPLFEEVVLAQEAAAGARGLATLEAKMNLGGLLAKDSNEAARGIRLLQEVVAGYEAALEPRHEATLGAKLSLAITLHHQMEYTAARPLFDEVVDGAEATLGTAHETTLGAKYKLGLMLGDQGVLARARVLLEQAVAGFEAAKGAGHPDTLVAKMNLANQLTRQAEPTAARLLYEEALLGLEAAFGPQHENTLRTKMNLAGLLMNMQAEAAVVQPLLEEAVAGFEAELGPQHSETVMAKVNLAILKQKQGEVASAESLFEEVMQHIEPNHPCYERARRGAAPLFAAVLRGLTGAAEHNGKRVNVRAFDPRKGRFRVELPDGKQVHVKASSLELVAAPVGTQVEVVGLTGSPHHNGRRGTVVSGPDEETERFVVKVGHHTQSHYGDREDTPGQTLGLKPVNLCPVGLQQNEDQLAALVRKLNSQLDQAVALAQQGNNSAARPLLDEAVAGFEAALGPRHESTLAAKLNLAGLLCGQEGGAAGRQLLGEVAADLEATLGPRHRRTLDAKYNLSMVLVQQGPHHLATARRVVEEAAAGYEVVLGPHHQDTRNAMQLLAQLAALPETHEMQGMSERPLTQARAGMNAEMGDDEALEMALALSRQAQLEAEPQPQPQPEAWVRHINNGRAFYRLPGDDASMTLAAPRPAAGVSVHEKEEVGFDTVWFDSRWERLTLAASATAEPEGAPQPQPEPTGFVALRWPTGEAVGSLAGFLAGPPGSLPASALPQYAGALAGLAPAELAEEAAVAAAGVAKVFHRRRICKWAASLSTM